MTGGSCTNVIFHAKPFSCLQTRRLDTATETTHRLVALPVSYPHHGYYDQTLSPSLCLASAGDYQPRCPARFHPAPFCSRPPVLVLHTTFTKPTTPDTPTAVPNAILASQVCRQLGQGRPTMDGGDSFFGALLQSANLVRESMGFFCPPNPLPSGPSKSVGPPVSSARLDQKRATMRLSHSKCLLIIFCLDSRLLRTNPRPTQPIYPLPLVTAANPPPAVYRPPLDCLLRHDARNTTLP